MSVFIDEKWDCFQLLGWKHLFSHLLSALSQVSQTVASPSKVLWLWQHWGYHRGAAIRQGPCSSLTFHWEDIPRKKWNKKNFKVQHISGVIFAYRLNIWNKESEYMQRAKQLGCPNDLSAFVGRIREICFPAAFPQVFWSGQDRLCYQGMLLSHTECTEWHFPVPWLCQLDRLSVQKRCAHCHFSPPSQKHWEIQMALLRKAWIIFHLLLHSGETKWNKIIYRRQLYPLLLTRYNESVDSWNNSSDFELMRKGWVGLKKQNAI